MLQDVAPVWFSHFKNESNRKGLSFKSAFEYQLEKWLKTKLETLKERCIVLFVMQCIYTELIKSKECDHPLKDIPITLTRKQKGYNVEHAKIYLKRGEYKFYFSFSIMLRGHFTNRPSLTQQITFYSFNEYYKPLKIVRTPHKSVLYNSDAQELFEIIENSQLFEIDVLHDFITHHVCRMIHKELTQLPNCCFFFLK